MASPAQLLANDLNSQKSTGPSSVEGKAASSMNALKHGARSPALLICGEDPEALARLTAAYREHYQPVGPEEELLLDTIVHADWTQRRMARLEAEVFDALLAEAEDATPGAAFLADAAGPNALQKIYRRQQSAQREWYRARGELSRLQQARHLAERTQSAPRPHSVERTQSAASRDLHFTPAPATQPPSAPAQGNVNLQPLDPTRTGKAEVRLVL
jgi:hypothetical protein